jgi:hypothetical protein
MIQKCAVHFLHHLGHPNQLLHPEKAVKHGKMSFVTSEALSK